MTAEEFKMMSDIHGVLRGMLNTLEVIERLLCDIRDQGKVEKQAGPSPLSEKKLTTIST